MRRPLRVRAADRSAAGCGRCSRPWHWSRDSCRPSSSPWSRRPVRRCPRASRTRLLAERPEPPERARLQPERPRLRGGAARGRQDLAVLCRPRRRPAPTVAARHPEPRSTTSGIAGCSVWRSTRIGRPSPTSTCSTRYDAVPGGSRAALVRCLSRARRRCRPGPGSTTDGCVVTGRLDRIPMNTTTGMATGVVDPSHHRLVPAVPEPLDRDAHLRRRQDALRGCRRRGELQRSPTGASSAARCPTRRTRSRRPTRAADPVDPAHHPPAQNPPTFDATAQGGGLRAQNVRHLAQPGLARTARSSGSTRTRPPARPRPGNPLDRLGRPQQAADRGLWPAQPVPVRGPARDERPVDRRRRLQHVGGAGPPADSRRRPAGPDQLRLAVLREPRLRQLLQRG